MFDAAKPGKTPELSGICAIAVMAKAPRAGRSKTRLTPPLQPEQAAALSAAFLRDTTENIVAAARETPIHAWAAFAPAGTETLFAGHLAEGTQLVLADGSPEMPADVQGFGRCLLHAMQSLIARGYDSVCLLNSDGPTLPTRHLAHAARLLAAPGDRAVLGPAADGGYYLLGLKQAHAPMFADITWSTGAVAAQTSDRAKQIGLELSMLPSWYDIDDASSLRQLLEDLENPPEAATPFPAPATRACLQQLGLLGAKVR